MARDIVERLKETAIMLPRSGYVSVGREATEASDEITALRARLAEVEAQYSLAVEGAQMLADRAEAAEAALATARRNALEEAAKVCNERGAAEQVNYGLNRGTQNYFRARDAIRALIAQEQEHKDKTND